MYASSRKNLTSLSQTSDRNKQKKTKATEKLTNFSSLLDHADRDIGVPLPAQLLQPYGRRQPRRSSADNDDVVGQRLSIRPGAAETPGSSAGMAGIGAVRACGTGIEGEGPGGMDRWGGSSAGGGGGGLGRGESRRNQEFEKV